MTETPTPETPDLTPVVPAGCDALDDLTAGELGVVGRHLKADPYEAVQGTENAAGLRWEAMALIAWVWRKRTDPRAKLAPIMALRGHEVAQLLGMGSDDTETDDDGAGDEGAPGENPTD